MIWVLIVIALLLVWLIRVLIQLTNNQAKWIQADIKLRQRGK